MKISAIKPARHKARSNSSAKPSKINGQLLNKEFHFSKTWTLEKRNIFFKELESLLESGITLTQSLELLRKGEEGRVGNAIQEVLDEYRSGSAFHTCLEKQGFTKFDCESIRVGESTGQLPEVMRQIVKFQSWILQLKSTIYGALSYPLFVIFLACIILYFMLTFLVPLFADTFSQNGATLPTLTLKVQSIASFIGDYGFFVFMALTTGIATLYFFRNNPFVKNGTSSTLWHAPGLKSTVRNIEYAKLCQTISTLTTNGIDIGSAIKLSSEMTTYSIVSQKLTAVALNIKHGESLSVSLKKAEIFPSRLVSMVSYAEDSNNIPITFDRLANQYFEKSNQSIARLKTFIEPALILGVGIFVGIILIALYLPIFSMTDLVR